MAGVVLHCLGYFTQDSAQDGFDFGEIGFDIADHYGFNFCPGYGFDRVGIKHGVIHAENHF